MAQISLKKTLAKLLSNEAMIDRFYPVGSYYETSDTTFDPNITWGGTWSLETEGLVHIGAGSNYTVGSSYGSDTHTHTTGDVTLNINQIPSHSHNYGNYTTASPSGGYIGYYTIMSGSVGAVGATNGAGGGQPHNHGSTGSTTRNSWQPSIAVNRWHRTA